MAIDEFDYEAYWADLKKGDMTDKDIIEAAAREIYYLMPYDGTSGPTKPDWVSGGNSLKQSEARRYAQAVIPLITKINLEEFVTELQGEDAEGPNQIDLNTVTSLVRAFAREKYGIELP